MVKSSSLFSKLYGLTDDEQGEAVEAFDRTVPEVHLHIGDERRTHRRRAACTSTCTRPPARSRDRCRSPASTTSTTPCRRRSAAFETWRTWTPWQRRDVLVRLADLLEASKDELARLSVLDNGMTYGIAHFTATSVVDYARYYAGWADKIEGRVTSSPAHGRELAYTAPEPYGVVGIIITWNGPLVSVGMKVIPALAAGNTVVVKPSELTPYATEHFMDLVREAGIPAGVVNVLPGHRRGRRGARAPPARAEDQLHRRARPRPGAILADLRRDA